MMDTLNNGKTITESFSHDTAAAIGIFEYYAGAAFHLHGESATSPAPPRSPAANRSGWSPGSSRGTFPDAALKLAPAFAAGCTVVWKPAESVCMSVLEFIADLVPPAVMNVVTGYGAVVGEPLVTHPKVRKVAFTGSRATVQKIMVYAAANIIPQNFELGGSPRTSCVPTPMSLRPPPTSWCGTTNTT
jgi:acyl-CoA reductase-like NAD-dependent aldehyde dehydrogenase